MILFTRTAVRQESLVHSASSECGTTMKLLRMAGATASCMSVTRSSSVPVSSMLERGISYVYFDPRCRRSMKKDWLKVSAP